jgi:hypothetical protein
MCSFQESQKTSAWNGPTSHAALAALGTAITL